jgi:hypothetical protein
MTFIFFMVAKIVDVMLPCSRSIYYCQAFLNRLFKAAFFGQTDQKGPLLFGGLLSQYLRAALRAILCDRLVPTGKLAFRESAAAVKYFPAL